MKTFLLPTAALVAFLASASAADPSTVPPPKTKEGAEAYAKTVSVKTLVRTTRTAGGGPLVFPASPAEVSGIEVTIPAGSSTGWHRHAHSGFAYILQGKLRVVLQDSTRNEFAPGQAFAEVVNTLHNGINVGTDDVKLVAFFLSDSGKPISTKP